MGNTSSVTQSNCVTLKCFFYSVPTRESCQSDHPVRRHMCHLQLYDTVHTTVFTDVRGFLPVTLH